jgi:hypothetical protein
VVEELTGAASLHRAAGFVYFAVEDTQQQAALGPWALEIVPAVREAISAT